MATTVDPADSNIHYIGRWDHTSPSAPWAQQKGSAVRVNFQGTSISATLNTQSGEQFRIIVDGDSSTSFKSTLPSGQTFVLASGLTDADHNVEIHKETDKGRVTWLGMELDSGRILLAPPVRQSRRIVFYGDSNVAGHSLETERDQGALSLRGSYYTFAGITARRFDAEYFNISHNGTTIGSLLGNYQNTDWDSSLPQWDFALFPADVVVVNVGSNDILVATEEMIKASYHTLLDSLRLDHPAAHIILYNAFGWDYAEPAAYTHEVVAERQNAGDNNISVAVFPRVFEKFHGSEAEHAGMAEYLTRHLENVMGWSAASSDVMNGFGMDFALANGSFEQVAPFGGWGWRYFDDPGVNRIFDPAGSASGDHYLRLSDGAKSQQSNPASDGQLIDLNLMMRGALVGAEAKITISFRDQNQGGDSSGAVIEHEQTFTLSDTWQTYNMSATAPVESIFGYRIELEAGAGHTVDFDSLFLTPADADSDGIADQLDNCRSAHNIEQQDTDGDGVGNQCDADLNNDCIVNFIDVGLMSAVFFTADPDADLDSSGSVNFIDFAILTSMFLRPPGPSGISNICAT